MVIKLGSPQFGIYWKYGLEEWLWVEEHVLDCEIWLFWLPTLLQIEKYAIYVTLSLIRQFYSIIFHQGIPVSYLLFFWLHIRLSDGKTQFFYENRKGIFWLLSTGEHSFPPHMLWASEDTLLMGPVASFVYFTLVVYGLGTNSNPYGMSI